MLEEQNRIIAGRGLSIGASMLAEREHLLPLAEEGFDLAALHLILGIYGIGPATAVKFGPPWAATVLGFMDGATEA